MDLKELNNIQAQRHPWETSRLSALKRILTPHLLEGISVLDVGCGDGYMSRNLFSQLRGKEITAVDINLSDERIREIDSLSCGIKYQREMPAEGAFDLVLLLDVLEHIEADHCFLADLKEKYLTKSGKIMITVPAFQSIFSRHDVFLGHHRRYGLQELTQLAAGCGLSVRRSGYLFFSLLLPKLFLYRFLNRNKEPEGIGNWQQGKLVTRLIETILYLDNSLLLAASHFGINIPGLTGWVLCEKHE